MVGGAMSAADGVLAELGRLAGDLGPALAPPGGEELLTSITTAARDLFGAAACSLALLTDDESELVFTASARGSAGDVTGLRIPSGTGVAGWVVTSGQAISISDLSRDPRFARGAAETTGYVPTAMLAVPVETERRLLGVLTVLDRDTRRPAADSDMQLLALFANQAALAIEGTRAFADLGRLLLSAAAARADGDLAAALSDAASTLPPPERDLAELAAIFSRLGRAGEAERRLALRMVAEVLAYTERRPPRRG